MSTPPAGAKSWGPSDQTARRPDRGIGPKWFRRPVQAILITGYVTDLSATVLIMLLVVWCVVAVVIQTRIEATKQRGSPAARVVDAADPLAAVHAETARLGGGTYLGVDQKDGWRLAGSERAVLVLGPPRSGKSSAVMIPAILAHPGATVSASTKPDVLEASIAARSQTGTAWRFDPTGQSSQSTARVLRWSPVPASRSWDGALLMARAMVTGAGVGAGTTDGTHWSKRATAMLAALLHAAAVDGRGVEAVLDWVLRHELDEPGLILDQAEVRLAGGVLVGLQNTEARERSSICSAAADALDAYTSHTALAAATDPNFDADRFVRSRDTIYVHAPAEHQALAAPLVCGLLAEIRRATYHAHHQRQLPRGVLFALDEIANIAPLSELPAIAAEGGGQGLQLLAALQDLSQARARWGTAADGFLTLFGSKLILPGVADSKTLEAVSLALGEYDRQVVSTTKRRNGKSFLPELSKTVSTQRQRVLSPGEVANIPAGKALHLDGLAWELLVPTPAHREEPWRTITQLPSPASAPSPS